MAGCFFYFNFPHFPFSLGDYVKVKMLYTL